MNSCTIHNLFVLTCFQNRDFFCHLLSSHTEPPVEIVDLLNVIKKTIIQTLTLAVQLVHQLLNGQIIQPLARQSLGLLEKKKDYKIRADYQHKKTSVLKGLQLKAALRNPDEFNTRMITLSRVWI